ncbi:MAG: hypothetical protein JWO24_1730 [Rhodospirillales bacterium]|nr:hypothetical protein [Rhodospirillales bacterium]
MDAKDARSGDVLSFRLRVFDLGLDADRDSIATCVAEEADPPSEGSEPRRRRANEKSVMQAYDRLGLGRLR